MIHSPLVCLQGKQSCSVVRASALYIEGAGFLPNSPADVSQCRLDKKQLPMFPSPSEHDGTSEAGMGLL